METMKKQWGKPLTSVQEFVPQEFIAACDPDDRYVKYEFWCDAGGGTTWNVYYDTNKNQQYDEGIDQYYTNFYACREEHDVTVHIGVDEFDVDTYFPMGIIRRRRNIFAEWQEIPVRIWKGENNDNCHCTTHLDITNWSIHNPS